MVEGSPKKTTSLEPRTNSLNEDNPSVGSTNQRHRDEALGETHAAVPSDSTSDSLIESNCSLELSPELQPSEHRRAISGVSDLDI
jgi:hypothetical protein